MRTTDSSVQNSKLSSLHVKASYLVRRGSSYHFRCVIPKHLRELVGQREVRRAMPMCSAVDLKRTAFSAISKLQSLFQSLDVAIDGGVVLNRADISKLVHDVLDNEIENLMRKTFVELADSSRSDIDEWKSFIGTVGYNCYANKFSKSCIEFGLDDIQKAFALKPNERSGIDNQICGLVGNVDPKSLSSPHLGKHDPSRTKQQRADDAKLLELAQAMIVAKGVAYTHAMGDLTFSDAMRGKAHTDLDHFYSRANCASVQAGGASVPSVSTGNTSAFPQGGVTAQVGAAGQAVAQASGQGAQGVNSLTVRAVIKKYIAESCARDNDVKTEQECKHTLELFCQAEDVDRPIEDLSPQMMLDFDDLLGFLPTRREARFPNVPVLEFRDNANMYLEAEKLGLKIRWKRLAMIRTFVNWMPRRSHCTFDESKRLSLTLSERINILKNEYEKNGGSTRTSFSNDELKRLFDADIYISKTNERPERFWLPILSLYTGGRTQDLLTLRRKDIKVTPDNPDIYYIKDGSVDEDTSRNDIPYIDLTDTMEKDLKTVRANRVIPIHPFVWNTLGFERYIQSFEPDQYLFGNHIKDDGELSNSFGAWFTRYRRSIGVGRQKKEKTGRDLVFHSFRHNTKRALRLKKCNASVVHEVIGHDDESETSTSKGYSGEYLIEQKLDDVISKLDFHEELPLAELTKSRWASGPSIE